MRHLFPDEFLSGVGRLSLVVKPAPPRLAPGVNLSPRPGASLEFRDYQPYVPGDDLRRVDWAVYGRTRHLFVRRFERPTAVPVFILVDASASMHLPEFDGGPSRFATAARLAAAVTSAAVAGHNPLRMVIADGQSSMPQAVSGKRGLVRVLADLAADRPQNGPGPAAALQAAMPALAAQGRGILVVVSDFFEQAGVDAIIDALRLIPQRLVLLRVTQPQDANPQIESDLELTDCETNARLPLSADADVIRRYQEAYNAYFAKLDEYAAARGATSASFDATKDTLSQLERLFPGGVLSL